MTLPCLYTSVKNMAGHDLYFGFLPPHGVLLADGETLSVRGDLTTRIASARDADRAFPSFEECLDDTEIVILKTPAVVLYDETDEVVRELTVAGGELGVSEPCWGYYSEDGGDSVAGG